MTTLRVGLGWDIHRLVEGRPLFLGGVQIPFAKGLLGHSDADVLLHAVTDALLGAAALPDIGAYFPPQDPQWEGVSSARMLARALEETRARGYRVVNIDSVVIAEAPKIIPHREKIRQSLAGLLKVPVGAVQVKGKTQEQLDAVGQGSAIAAQAVVLLEKQPARPASKKNRTSKRS